MASRKHQRQDATRPTKARERKSRRLPVSSSEEGPAFSEKGSPAFGTTGATGLGGEV